MQDSSPGHTTSPSAYWYVSIFLVCAVVALMCVSTIADDDIFWHLANGRWIWEHGAIPDSDILSYPTEGMRYLPTEWGWDLATFLFVQWTGSLTSLHALTVTVWLCIMVLLCRTLKNLGIALTVVIPLLLLTALMSLDRMTPRPHLVTLLGLAFVLTLFIRARYLPSGSLRTLFVLPAVFIAWANMHPGVLGGMFLLSLLLISEVLRFLTHRHRQATTLPAPLTRNELVQFGVVWLACLAALTVNPHGWQTWEYLATHANLRLLSTVIEWQSPFSPVVSSGIVWIYRIALVVYAIAVYYAIRKRDYLPALLYVAFALYSLRAVRFQADFAIVTVVGAAMSLHSLLTTLPPVLKRALTGSVSIILLMIATASLLVAVPGDHLYRAMRYHNHFGTGVDNDYFSEGMMKFMKANAISGRPFHNFSIGGWLSWEIPGEKTFIDSRDIDEAIADTYDSIMTMMPGFTSRLAGYGVDYVVIQVPDLRVNPSGMQSTLIPFCSTNRDRWKLVYWDDFSFLYLKNIGRFRGTIDRYEYRILDPFLYSARHAMFDSLKNADEERFASELRRKITEEPNGAIVNYFVLYARQSGKR